jgi:hypothetical protein
MAGRKGLLQDVAAEGAGGSEDEKTLHGRVQ